MAEERKILIDLEVGDRNFNAEIGEVNEQLEENRKNLRELKKDYSENSEEIAKLEIQNKKLSRSKRELIKESQTESNSLNALRVRLAKLTAERNNLDTSIEGNAERFESLQKEIKATSEEIKGFEEAGGDFRRNVGNYSTALDGFKGSINAAGLALKALGIGLLIQAFTKLSDAFSQNQKVADLFSKASEGLSIVLSDIVNLVVDGFPFIIDAFKAVFNDPLGAIQQLGQLIQANLIERFNSLIDTLGFAGQAIAKLFAGEFSEAADLAIKAGKELADVATGIDGTFDKATEAVTTYAASVAKTADANVDLANKAALAEAKQQKIIQELERRAEKLRQIRDDDSRSIEERIEANNKLGEVLAEQEEAELALVQTKVDLAQAELDKNNNIENQIALIQAQTEEADVLNRIEGQRSEQLSNQIALQKELNELRKEESDLLLDNIAEDLELFEEGLDNQVEAKLAADATMKESESALTQFRIDAAASVAENVIGSLQNIVGENKALALTQVAVDTGKALGSALVNANSVASVDNAFSGGLAAIAKYANIASTIISGASKAVGIIKSGNVSSSAGGGGSLAPASNSSAASIDIVQPQLLSQFSEPAFNSAQSRSTAPVFVTVTDIKKGLKGFDAKVSESTLTG